MTFQTLLLWKGVDLDEKVSIALETIRQYAPKEGYYGCFSGGKDSVVVKDLVTRAGVGASWSYNVTTIDPPELCRSIRRHHPEVVWQKPKKSLWKAVATNGLPTRRLRWCCKLYKERWGTGRVKLTGIRAAESSNRKASWSTITKSRKGGWFVNPILFWTDEDVWEYIERERLPVCGLYSEGWKRLGCIGCPFNSRRIEQFKRWPLFEKGWRKAAQSRWDRMIERKLNNRTLRTFRDSGEWFEWWLSNKSMPADPGCLSSFV